MILAAAVGQVTTAVGQLAAASVDKEQLAAAVGQVAAPSVYKEQLAAAVGQITAVSEHLVYTN